MTDHQMEQLTSAIQSALHTAFVSPNESDRNGEAANIVDAISITGRSIERALRAIGTGNAATDVGGMEFIALSLRDGMEAIAASIKELAKAIEEHD